MAESVVLTQVGRCVWGHPNKMVQQTDDDGKPRFKEDGSPDMAINFGLALPKDTFGEVWAAMQAAAAGVPGFSMDRNAFSWKYKDGDTDLDQNGKPYRDKPGMAGCFIIAISTSIRELAVVSRMISPGVYQAMGENEVKCGDFFRVSLKIVGHGPNPKKRGSKSGIYLNPQGTEFIGYGEAIVSGPSASDLFGKAPAVALPPGASATPVAPSSTMGMPPSAAPVPTMPPAAPVTPPGMQQPMSSPPGLPGPVSVPSAVPTMPQPSPVASPLPVPTASPSSVPPQPQPHPQFVQNALPVAPAPVPAPQPAPAPAPMPGGNGQQPVGYDATTGRPIFGYTLYNGQQFPIFGYNPDGSPIYQ